MFLLLRRLASSQKNCTPLPMLRIQNSLELNSWILIRFYHNPHWNFPFFTSFPQILVYFSKIPTSFTPLHWYFLLTKKELQILSLKPIFTSRKFVMNYISLCTFSSVLLCLHMNESLRWSVKSILRSLEKFISTALCLDPSLSYSWIPSCYV